MSSTTAAKPNASTHLAFLDGVRGLAAVYVVFGHAAYNLPESDHMAPIEIAMRKLGGVAHYSVDVFIVLSGYCLMLPQLTRVGQFDIATFIRRRAWRILPPYYLSCLVSLALIATVIGEPTGTHWAVSIPVSLRDIVYHALLIHDWFPDLAAKINHAHWSVAVEWKIYFLFPLLLGLASRHGGFKVALAATALGYLAWFICYQLDILNPTPWGSTFYYVGLFAMGMFGAMQRAVPATESSLKLWRAALIGLSLLVAVLSFRPGSKLLIDQLKSLVVGSWAVVLLVCLAYGALPSWFARIFTTRAVAKLGTIAYSIYLIHAPFLELVFIYIVRPMGDTPLRAPVMVGASLVVSIGVAWLFYLVAEKPFHEISRRSGRNARPVASLET